MDDDSGEAQGFIGPAGEQAPRRAFEIDNPMNEGERLVLHMGVSVYEALNFAYSYLVSVRELDDDEARAELLEAYTAANLALGNVELTEREELLGAAFFALGLKMGKQITTHPRLERAIAEHMKVREQRRKGGQHSHWKPYRDIIEKHLAAYGSSRALTKAQVIDAIEREAGVSPLSVETFNGWWKKYKRGSPIFTFE